ncbi:hypothetical protein B0H14DRAFT_3164163 [Mycena olivaceomarginata]|nr:hypothetical protein B0H14DRAFT_3164163 [Mycena olivaceomarginata]
MPRPKKSKSKRTTKSKSSATSSTLASPPPTSPSFPHGVRDSPLRDSGVEFGAFTSGGAEDEFDGTPGGFGSSFGVEVEAEAEAEPEVLREALPSPGLSRGAGGFRFGGGGVKGLERQGGWRVHGFFTTIPHDTTTIRYDFDFDFTHCFFLYMCMDVCVIHLSAGHGCIDRPSDLDASIGPEEALNAEQKKCSGMADWLAACISCADPNVQRGPSYGHVD